MRILLVTISARGHAIAEALKRSPQNPEIIHICPSRNPGIRKLAEEQYVVDSLMNFDAILDISAKTKPDFAFIGPEDPIGGGLADLLDEHGIPSVAPLKSPARVESSKQFLRDLLIKYGINASPRYKTFTTESEDDIRRYIELDLCGEYVVKNDGLCAGKGVKVSGDHLNTVADGVAYAMECIHEGGRVVIEEKMTGVEFSLISFASGNRVVDMPVVQDHKRAFDGDTGPNTGGMGSYSDANHSLPFLTDANRMEASNINRRVAEALLLECQEPYKGILYGGFMITRSGLRVVEYNCRFGDPEVMNILPLLTSDFVGICKGIIDGTLSQYLVRFEKKATVCLYITPKGYPENNDQKGEIVAFPSKIPANARIYFGDIAEDADGTLRLGGSRTAGIVGIGDSIEEARRVALSICGEVKGPVRYRSDIGSQELIAKRVAMVK